MWLLTPSKYVLPSFLSDNYMCHKVDSMLDTRYCAVQGRSVVVLVLVSVYLHLFKHNINLQE